MVHCDFYLLGVIICLFSAKLESVIHTPSETYWLSICEPPFGTMRVRFVTNGGYRRSDSSMTAERYFSEGLVRKVISVSLLKEERISLPSMLMVRGFLHR